MLTAQTLTNFVSTLPEDLVAFTLMPTYRVLFPTEKDGGEGEPEESLSPRFRPEDRRIDSERRPVFSPDKRCLASQFEPDENPVGGGLFMCLRGPRFPEDPSGGGEYRPDAPLGSGIEDFAPLFDPDTGGGGGNDILAGPFVPMLILLCLLFPGEAKGSKPYSSTVLYHLVEVSQFPEGRQS